MATANVLKENAAIVAHEKNIYNISYPNNKKKRAYEQNDELFQYLE